MVFKYVRPRTTRFFDHAHFHADVPSKNNIQHVKKRVEHSVSNCKCDPSELGSVLDHMTRVIQLPWIGPLLESLPFSKLPTNHTVIQRLYFEVERNHGSSGLDVAAVKVKNALFDLWTYAGYGDILHHPTFFIKKLKSLTLPYKSLFKTPVSRRSTPSFLKKESEFLKSLTKLFNITVQDLIFSGKITNEDRDFLLHHWTKRISSTPDLPLRTAVQTKLLSLLAPPSSSPRTSSGEWVPLQIGLA